MKELDHGMLHIDILWLSPLTVKEIWIRRGCGRGDEPAEARGYSKERVRRTMPARPSM
jgi:hypothetical protein